MTLQFDTTISLGNILTVLAIVLGFVLKWDRQALEIKTMKAWITAHELCNKTQLVILEELRESMAYMKGKLDGASEIGTAVSTALRAIKGRLDS